MHTFPLRYIAGCQSTKLTQRELALFKDRTPAGLILFTHNVETPAQVRALTDQFRAAVDDPDAMVLIDQEGGRVQRLRPPHWRRLPSASAYAKLYRKQADDAMEAAHLVARLMAEELRRDGINVNCTPVLDRPARNAHWIIGDRAFGKSPEQIIALAGVVAAGHLEGGVLPVIKHVPGHGRAKSDSHKTLPVITTNLATLRKTDFEPFAALSDLPLAMTAHVVLSAIDETAPATLSPIVMQTIVREEIGLDSLIMSDDLSMRALKGSYASRTRRALEAGCDLVLHCSGKTKEVEAVAANATPLEGDSRRRWETARSFLEREDDYDRDKAIHWVERMLAL